MKADWQDVLWGAMLYVGAAVLSIVVLFALYIILVYAPFEIMAQKECLERGYPAWDTTIDLDRYCINTEGVVVGKVYKLEDSE